VTKSDSLVALKRKYSYNDREYSTTERNTFEAILITLHRFKKIRHWEKEKKSG